MIMHVMIIFSYMMVISVDHVPSSYMISIYDDQIGSSYVDIVYGCYMAPMTMRDHVLMSSRIVGHLRKSDGQLYDCCVALKCHNEKKRVRRMSAGRCLLRPIRGEAC